MRSGKCTFLKSPSLRRTDRPLKTDARYRGPYNPSLEGPGKNPVVQQRTDALNVNKYVFRISVISGLHRISSEWWRDPFWQNELYLFYSEEAEELYKVLISNLLKTFPMPTISSRCILILWDRLSFARNYSEIGLLKCLSFRGQANWFSFTCLLQIRHTWGSSHWGHYMWVVGSTRAHQLSHNCSTSGMVSCVYIQPCSD